MNSWRPWKNYREALLHFYFVRRNRNSKYSMRAYARDLKISPPRLNGIIKGKFGLSFEAAKLIGKSLGLSYGDKSLFQYMVESEHGRSEVSRATAKEFVERNIETPSIDQIEHNKYNSFLSWKNFTLLEMIQNPRFKNDPKWISECTGIDPVEVKQLLEELIKTGAILKKDGQLVIKEDFIYVAGTNNCEVIQNFQKELLRKIDQSIVTANPDEIAFNTWVISIDKSRIQEAQHAMNEFQQEFCKQFGRLGLPTGDDSFKNRNAVYSISGYLIPLANLEKSET